MLTAARPGNDAGDSAKRVLPENITNIRIFLCRTYIALKSGKISQEAHNFLVDSHNTNLLFRLLLEEQLRRLSKQDNEESSIINKLIHVF